MFTANKLEFAGHTLEAVWRDERRPGGVLPSPHQVGPVVLGVRVGSVWGTQQGAIIFMLSGLGLWGGALELSGNAERRAG